jgi:hypothetical protein
MVTASILAVEEPAPDGIRTPTRRELHEGFDLWLDALEDTMKEEPPSLDALARSVLASRQELTAQALWRRRAAATFE